MLHGALVLILTSLITLATKSSAEQSIYSALNSTANVSFFYSSLGDANLVTTFSNTTLNLTLLVPTDAAFLELESKLNISGDLFFLPTLARKAEPILRYHFVTPSIPIESIASGNISLSNAFGSTVLKVSNLSLAAGNATGANTTSVIRVSGIGSDANITSYDISAGNSKIHVIDNVLLPFYVSISSGLSRNANLSTINKLTTKLANNSAFLNVWNNTSTEYTVLAPINSAFNNPDQAVNATLTKLLNSTIGLVYLWNYHTIPKPVFLDALSAFNASINQTVVKVTTVAGLPLTLVKSESTVTVVSPSGNATILSSFNVGLTNSGTFRSAIHLISQALVPPSLNTVREALALRSNVSSFLALLGNSSYGTWLSSTSLRRGTLLVPTDAAFSALLAQYPGYDLEHLIQGKTGVSQLLALHVIESSTITLSGLANGVTNITVTDGKVLLRANKSSSTGAVKFLSFRNSANVVGSDYYIGAVGSGLTVIVIDAVLVPEQFDMGAGSGATSLAGPSPLATLICSLLAAVLLSMFSRD